MWCVWEGGGSSVGWNGVFVCGYGAVENSSRKYVFVRTAEKKQMERPIFVIFLLRVAVCMGS